MRPPLRALVFVTACILAVALYQTRFGDRDGPVMIETTEVGR